MSLSRTVRTIPSLRFAEFKDHWKATKLDSSLIEKNALPDEDTPLYSLTIQNGITAKTERYERAFLVNDEVNAYKKMKKDDFAYNPMNLRFGALARHKQDFDVKVSKYYDIFAVNDSASTEFLEYLLKTSTSIKYYNRMATGSLVEKKRVHFSDFKTFEFPLPKLPEQQKIASFLSLVDEKIRLLERRLELLQTYKRGVMQKLFSQEVRFKREDGSSFPDWKEKKLNQLAIRQTTKNAGTTLTRVLTNSATQGVLDQRDYFDKDIANAENLAGYYVVSKGDFVYNPRISVHAPVGPINRNNLGDGVMSPLYSVFRFHDEDSEFYEQYFKTTFWHEYMYSIANYGARHDRMNITMSDFMDMPLPKPSKAEKTKIKRFLSAIDTKLDAVNAQISQMQSFKKGLLQQMFV